MGAGWEGGSRGRRYMYGCIYLIHLVVQQKLTQQCKAIILQYILKINLKIKIKNKNQKSVVGYHFSPVFKLALVSSLHGNTPPIL